MNKQVIVTPRKLRLRIDSAISVGNVDGFWWPHSRDFQSEATQLTEEFPVDLGRVTRILYSTPDWDINFSEPRARWLSTKDSRIKVGSFPNDDTSLLIVHTDRGMRLVLLVIPCESTSETLAESVENRSPGSAIHAEYAQREVDPLAGWEDDGGHFE